jgi:hypothetical protein
MGTNALRKDIWKGSASLQKEIGLHSNNSSFKHIANTTNETKTDVTGRAIDQFSTAAIESNPKSRRTGSSRRGRRTNNN